MNIAITLPKNLWDKIVSGKKTIELRKHFPQSFNKNNDYVFVILKGTNKVVGALKIEDFEPEINSFVLADKHIIKAICVDIDWIYQYIRHSTVVFLWKIHRTIVFSPARKREEDLGLSKNPQSFVYIKNESLFKNT